MALITEQVEALSSAIDALSSRIETVFERTESVRLSKEPTSDDPTYPPLSGPLLAADIERQVRRIWSAVELLGVLLSELEV